jgi:hypothetical protein
LKDNHHPITTPRSGREHGGSAAAKKTLRKLKPSIRPVPKLATLVAGDEDFRLIHRRHRCPAGDKAKGSMMANLLMTGLHHDTNRKRSIVYVRWEDDAEKNLGLIVPFGCSLEDAREEAAMAVQALAAELVSATVKL